MCQSTLSHISTFEIIQELQNRGLFTNAKSNEIILKNLNEGEELKFILTKGLPVEHMDCRECRSTLEPSQFSFYLSRVDHKGFLIRSNALCDSCAIKSNKERKVVLDSASIPDVPNKGDECPKCKRSWTGRWHRHHEGNEFIEWLCGHCNTHLSDQRNKLV